MNFLMLRLKGTIHEPFLEDAPVLRRALIAGRVEFPSMRQMVADHSDLDTLREFVRCTGRRHIKSNVQMKIMYFPLNTVGFALLQNIIMSLYGFRFLVYL